MSKLEEMEVQQVEKMGLKMGVKMEVEMGVEVAE